MHPPARFLACLPIGPVSFRIGLFCALCGAVTVVCLYLIVRSVALSSRSTPPGEESRAGRRCGRPLSLFHALLASAAGLSLFLADSTWFHTVNIEVYVPNLALCSFLLLCAVFALAPGSRQSGWLALLAVAGGLSLGMHITSVMVFGLCVTVVLATLAGRSPGGVRAAIGQIVWPGILLFLLASLVVLYLPIRAAMEPVRNWGDPSQLGSLLEHLSGARIRSSFENEILNVSGVSLGTNASAYFGQLWSQAGSALVVAGLALALYPAALARRKRPQQQVACAGRVGPRFAGFLAPVALLALVLIADAAFSILVNPMAQQEKQTSFLSLFVLFTGAAIGLAITLDSPWSPWTGKSRTRQHVELILAGLAGVLLVSSPLSSLSASARECRTSSAAYDLGRYAYRAAGPDSVIAASSNDAAAMTIYMSEVENRRPDTISLIQQWICDDDFVDPVLRRAPLHPALAIIQDSRKQACESRDMNGVRRAWAQLAAGLASSRTPLSYELGNPPLDNIFLPVLRIGFPLMTVDWLDPPGTQRNAEPPLFDLRDFQQRFPPSRTDDMTAGAVAEYEKLLASYLLKRSGMRPGSDAIRACQALETGLLYSPSHCGLLNNLAVCRSVLGDGPGAVDQAALAAQTCPQHFNSRLNHLRFLMFWQREVDLDRLLRDLVRDFPESTTQPRLSQLEADLRRAGLHIQADSIARVLLPPVR